MWPNVATGATRANRFDWNWWPYPLGRGVGHDMHKTFYFFCKKISSVSRSFVHKSESLSKISGNQVGFRHRPKFSRHPEKFAPHPERRGLDIGGGLSMEEDFRGALLSAH